MTSSKNFLVLTDLDGTLIDHDTYSWKGVEQAIEELKQRGIPIIPCTSKTRAEIEVYRAGMGLSDPFISENGGAIFIPKDYFDFDYEYDCEIDCYKVIELGLPYQMLREFLDDLRAYGEIIGFGDLSPEELAKESGLPVKEARLAKQREYDEAFTFNGDEEGLELAIVERGMNWTRGGRYWHIMGNNDKGKAIKKLIGLYSRLGEFTTIGLGDSLNDAPMLSVVDLPILVQKKDGSFDSRVDVDGLIRAGGAGPIGWNEEILKALKGRS